MGGSGSLPIDLILFAMIAAFLVLRPPAGSLPQEAAEHEAAREAGAVPVAQAA